MKKFKMLGKAEMKKVKGGTDLLECGEMCAALGEENQSGCITACLSGEIGRCKTDTLCGAFGGFNNAGCMTMATGQCRCVRWANNVPVESVPDSYCLAS